MLIDDARLRTLLADAVTAADPTLPHRLTTEPEAHLDLVALTARTRAETEAMLRAAVDGARAAGCSWESIGRSLGASGQEAHADVDRVIERARADNDRADDEADDAGVVEQAGATTKGRVMRLSPLYPFNEMSVLENAGRYGWHAVAAGSGMHFVRPSDVQWEHRRVFASPATCRMLEQDGWERWAPGWFPWAYFNRPTGIPAEPEPPDLDLMHP